MRSYAVPGGEVGAVLSLGNRTEWICCVFYCLDFALAVSTLPRNQSDCAQQCEEDYFRLCTLFVCRSAHHGVVRYVCRHRYELLLTCQSEFGSSGHGRWRIITLPKLCLSINEECFPGYNLLHVFRSLSFKKARQFLSVMKLSFFVIVEARVCIGFFGLLLDGLTGFCSVAYVLSVSFSENSWSPPWNVRLLLWIPLVIVSIVLVPVLSLPCPWRIVWRASLRRSTYMFSRNTTVSVLKSR